MSRLTMNRKQINIKRLGAGNNTNCDGYILFFSYTKILFSI